jgi:hypothetical protein
MALALTLLCNSWIFLIELSSLSLCMHSSYTTVSAICSLHSLYLYHIPHMIIRVIQVPQHWFQYSNVCSSMMSIDPEGRGSAQGTRVSLINEGMGLG